MGGAAVRRVYRDLLSVSAEAGLGLVDDIRNGDLVPDPMPNWGGEYDEKRFHDGFVRFLGSDLSCAIIDDMKSEHMYEWD